MGKMERQCRSGMQEFSKTNEVLFSKVTNINGCLRLAGKQIEKLEEN